MQKKLLGILLISVLSLPCVAQKISIGQFKQVKFDLATQKFFPVDKKMATLDLKTDEKGFMFDCRIDRSGGVVAPLASD